MSWSLPPRWTRMSTAPRAEAMSRRPRPPNSCTRSQPRQVPTPKQQHGTFAGRYPATIHAPAFPTPRAHSQTVSPLAGEPTRTQHPQLGTLASQLEAHGSKPEAQGSKLKARGSYRTSLIMTGRPSSMDRCAAIPMATERSPSSRVTFGGCSSRIASKKSRCSRKDEPSWRPW